MMLIQTLLLGVLLAGGDAANWPMNVSSGGENIYWQSPGTVRDDGDTYFCSITVEYAEATVEYAGIEFGPFDVSDQIPGEVYNDLTEGPCPATFPVTQFVTPEPPGPVTLAFDLHTELLGSGQCSIVIDNIVLGTSEYDLGWPFGWVTVDVVHMSFESTVHMNVSGTWCASDIDGSGSVDTTDLLAVLAGWGDCAGDCPADISGDGVVDVTDLLQLIADFGACA
jgi:hypothetical protein